MSPDIRAIVFCPRTQQLITEQIPCLVARDGRVHFGVIGESNAALRYDREIVDQLYRAMAAMRFTNVALTFYDAEGTILQQNAVSP